MDVLLPILLVSSWVSGPSQDTIVLQRDPRLDVLVQKQALANKRSAMMTSTGQYKGYRLQTINSPSRTAAEQMRSAIMSRFPDQKTYLQFQSPNFRVRVGNFLRKEDAENFRKQLARFFPENVYVVEDTIEYLPKDEELQ
ncbi:MAG: SPOR domain-containing protein [Sphingobacteriia bacterium]|nr:MAG: SPOR domain-containing protein [Sphingobacteriia bacterium]